MPEVARKLQSDDPNAELCAAVVAVLRRQDERRMALNTLQTAMRGQGWGGWSSPRGWAPLCLQMGLYVYAGRTGTGAAVIWVALDQPGEIAIDEFATSGFVVIDSHGRYYRRDQVDPSFARFTALRSRARVWSGYAWAVRRIRQLDSNGSFDIASTRHMR